MKIQYEISFEENRPDNFKWIIKTTKGVIMCLCDEKSKAEAIVDSLISFLESCID
jgi:hypothetical protein